VCLFLSHQKSVPFIIITQQFGGRWRSRSSLHSGLRPLRLDSTRSLDGDLRANAILGLGNPRVERIFPNTKAPKAIGPPTPPSSQRVHRSLYKRVRPSFVTSCHLLPTLYLPPPSFGFPQLHRKDNSYSSHYASVFQDQYSKSAVTRSDPQRAHDPQRCKTGQRKTKNYSSCGLVFAATHFALRTRTRNFALLPSPYSLQSLNASLPTRAHSLLAHSHTRNARICPSARLKHGSVRSQPAILALYRTFTLIII